MLGVLLYKPTLLVLFLPLLLVGRRWRTLGGIAVTGLAMVGLSLLAVGEAVCRDYVDTLVNFTGTASGRNLTIKEWKWVDLNFFLRLLLGGPSIGQKVVWVVLALPPLGFLARSWWARAEKGEEKRTLVWAASTRRRSTRPTPQPGSCRTARRRHSGPASR